MVRAPSNLRQCMPAGRHTVTVNGWILPKPGARKRGTFERAGSERSSPGACSAATKMAQIDHRICQSFESVVDVGDHLVANQHATKLVLPGEHAFDGAKAFFEDGRTEQALGSTLGGFPGARVLVDVGNHATAEDRFAVGLAIVDTVKTDDAASKIDANSLGDARQLRQRLTQQRRLITVARRGDKWRNHVAVAIAKRDDLVALDVFVPAEANVVATLLGHSRGAVAVNHRCVEQIVLKQSSHRTRENCIDTAVDYPATKDSVDARVMDFRQPICVLFNGQHFPLAPQVELQQNVVENLVQRQFDMRPSASAREVGQDKFLKLLNTQIRWNPLPLLAFRHLDRQSGRILPYVVDIAQTQRSCGLADNSTFKKTRNQLSVCLISS